MEEYGEGQRTDLSDEEGEGVDGGKNTWLTDPVIEWVIMTDRLSDGLTDRLNEGMTS